MKETPPPKKKEKKPTKRNKIYKIKRSFIALPSSRGSAIMKASNGKRGVSFLGGGGGKEVGFGSDGLDFFPAASVGPVGIESPPPKNPFFSLI